MCIYFLVYVNFTENINLDRLEAVYKKIDKLVVVVMLHYF